jgi:predicted nucleic acid-binding protein
VIVADASAIIQACLSEVDVGELRSFRLAAPPLLWSEVTSAMHELRWRGQISAQLAQAALAKFSKLPVRARRPAGLYEEAWRLADRLGWAKTYHAEYVALAHLARCQLLTIDARMAATVGSLVEVVSPNDLSGYSQPFRARP